MNKYFAFFFSFLFILVSVFSFSSFGSVHAQEFTKTVQFTKFPFSIESKEYSGSSDNITTNFSSSSNSVRYSFIDVGNSFMLVFFSNSSFNVVSKASNMTNPDSYSGVKVDDTLYYNRISDSIFDKNILVNPSFESLKGKSVTLPDTSNDTIIEYCRYALGQEVDSDHGIDDSNGPSTHVSDLGSLQLLENNPWSWANVEKSGNQITQQTFVARFKPETTTGKLFHKDFDGYQVMIEAKDVRYVNNFTNGVSEFPDGITLKNGESYKKILPDIQGIQMPLISVDYPSKFYKDVFSDYGVEWTNQANNNLGIAHRITFKCVFYVRPVKGDSYGDWLRIETERNTFGGSDGTFQTGTSSDDPNSTDFIDGGDIISGKGSTGKGDSVESALDNASTTYNPFKGNTIWSDDWKVNFENLTSPLTAIPEVFRMLFSWLPSWLLTMFAVAFGAIPIIIIYKLLRG